MSRVTRADRISSAATLSSDAGGTFYELRSEELSNKLIVYGLRQFDQLLPFEVSWR
jgi:hypothetical protein